jgi:hypothetical protein
MNSILLALEPNWTAWGAIGQWVAGIGTFCLLVFALYQDFWRRPKLQLSFDKDRDLRAQVNTVGMDPSAVSIWLRVMVTNKPGRRAARNCRAYLASLTDIGFHPDGAEVLPGDVRQLSWMHDPVDQWNARDILPGVCHWVDVLKFGVGSAFAEMCAYPSVPLGSPGDYLLAIQVSAEDAEPELIKLRVQWTNSSEGVRAEVVV